MSWQTIFNSFWQMTVYLFFSSFFFFLGGVTFERVTCKLVLLGCCWIVRLWYVYDCQMFSTPEEFYGLKSWIRHWLVTWWLVVAWRGVAWRGAEWGGVEWRDVAWRGVALRDVAWRGVAAITTTVSPKPSFGGPAPSRVGRGRGQRSLKMMNGWTTSKTGHPCLRHNCSRRPTTERKKQKTLREDLCQTVLSRSLDDGDFFLTWEDFGRMFDNLFPACAFYCFIFFGSGI